MKIDENTKVTLTIGQIKKLVKESLDYYRCHRCGNSVREDNLSLPGFLDSYFIENWNRALWREFINSHWSQIEELGVEHGSYGILMQPICPKCCKEISNDPRFVKLESEWEKAKKESLGGEDKEAELSDTVARVRENIAALKSALLDMYGNTAKDYSYKIEISACRYGSMQYVGYIEYPVITGDDVKAKGLIASLKEKGESFQAVFKLCKAGFTFSDNKHKNIDLGIDLMTADKEQTLAAFKKHKNEIWNFI